VLTASPAVDPMNIAEFYAASVGGGIVLGDLGIIGGTAVALKAFSEEVYAIGKTGDLDVPGALA
jgi:hypothetical protein